MVSHEVSALFVAVEGQAPACGQERATWKYLWDVTILPVTTKWTHDASRTVIPI